MSLSPKPKKPTKAEREIRELFDLWCKVMRKRSDTKLDHDRRKAIKKGLSLHSFEDCADSIRGCSIDPFSQGQNPRDKRFIRLGMIFKNADKTEEFRDIWLDSKSRTTEPKRPTFVPPEEPAVMLDPKYSKPIPKHLRWDAKKSSKIADLDQARKAKIRERSFSGDRNSMPSRLGEA